MNKQCKNCQANFIIEPDDFSFYEKIKVPPPTWCPECRWQRKYAWRNDRNLYRRPCDLCGKSAVAMYCANKPFKVYCQPCWWSDKWDPGEYEIDLDLSRPFLDQFAELQLKVPRIAMLGKNSVRSEYTNHSSDNKDSFMCFSAMFCENTMYSDFIFYSRDTSDCSTVYGKAERCYECTDIQNCYSCQYCSLTFDSANCMYCYDCRGCTDCFLSSNLRNKNNYFLNQQYTKEEYKRKIADFNLGSYKTRKKLYEQFIDLIQKNSIHKFATIERSNNSTGSYIYNSRNALNCFDVSECEDVKYCANLDDKVKDAYDSYRNAHKVELVYECHGLIRAYNVKFCNIAYDVSHLEYCDNCYNSQNLFGCVGVKKGEYMILNKKYSPEEFKAMKEKIIEDMKIRGEYGEFFPISLSPFGYNESHNMLFGKKLSKEDTIANGWKWEDSVLGTFGKETMVSEQIPDSIKDLDDEILNQALRCISCNRNYNVVQPELEFYRREQIPIPHKCFACRDSARIALRNSRKLYHRACMKLGCQNEFETSYSPDRPEIVYCETCYQQEVV